jgi:acyl carrier protein
MTTIDSTAEGARLRTWLTERLAEYTERDPGSIDAGAPLADYGLDSVYALALCGDIEDHLGVVIEPTVVWDHPSIDALVAYLSGLAPRQR